MGGGGGDDEFMSISKYGIICFLLCVYFPYLGFKILKYFALDKHSLSNMNTKLFGMLLYLYLLIQTLARMIMAFASFRMGCFTLTSSFVNPNKAMIVFILICLSNTLFMSNSI